MDLKEKLEYLEEIMDYEDEGNLKADMLLEDIEEWDSLSSLSLTVEVKKKYGNNLTTEEIKAFKTVQDICDYLEKLAK